MTALPANAARRRSLFGHPVFVAAIALAIVGFVGLWLDTGGRLVVWPSHTVYYELLADAFMHHQMSLRIQPRSELASLPDAYDPAANLPYRWHDVAYYDGKYYLPWGPAPALIVAFLGKIGVDTPYFDDEGLCALFLFGMVVMATILMRSLWSSDRGRSVFSPCGHLRGLVWHSLQARSARLAFGGGYLLGAERRCAREPAAGAGRRRGDHRLAGLALRGGITRFADLGYNSAGDSAGLRSGTNWLVQLCPVSFG
jgi:hypothetical protein